MELLSSAIPLMNGRRIGSGSSGHTGKKGEHKIRKQKLDKLESSIAELPACFEDLLKSLNGYCHSGVKLANLFDTVFEDTPLLMVAMRYREACEQLNEKCKRLEILFQPELATACKKTSPCVGQLRSCLDAHSKALSRYESAQNSLESISNAENASRQKTEQAETKFQNSLKDFAQEDTNLARFLDELDRLRVEAMGSCFLSLLEAQAQLLNSAAEIVGPLGSYKEVGKGLVDSQNNSVVKDAMLGWLAAAQVYRNLRTFGGLSRNDVQCMMYTGGEGLPDTIRSGLNNKVNQLLKSFTGELARAQGRVCIVPGGFHLNPKGIELALRDCCSELEALGAGAPHVHTRQEKEEQIERDVSRTSYTIGSITVGPAAGQNIQDNIQQKLMAIEDLASSLSAASDCNIPRDSLHEFAFHVLNESCTTVTNTAAKTAVQLVLGKANLILVRPVPSSEESRPIEVQLQGDSNLALTVHSTWWLVEDYATLCTLSRLPSPDAYLGVVSTKYTVQFSIVNFTRSQPSPEIPSITVECCAVNMDYLSQVHHATQGNSPNRRVYRQRQSKPTGSSRKTSQSNSTSATFQSYLPATSYRDDQLADDESADTPPMQRFTMDGEGQQDGRDSRSSYETSPLDGPSRSGRSDSLSRGGARPLWKCPSNESISTTSTVTIKANNMFESGDITDFLPSDMRSSRGLTQARVMALTKSERPHRHRYSHTRKEPHLQGPWTGEGGRTKDWKGDKDHEMQRPQLEKEDGEDFPEPKPGAVSFTPATPADFVRVFHYLSDGHYAGNGKGKEEGPVQSQVSVGGETDMQRPHNPHLMSNSSLGSIDSGIVLHHRGSMKAGDGKKYHSREGDDDGRGLDSILDKGFGPIESFSNYLSDGNLYHVSSDSDSESGPSGRGSRNMGSAFGSFRNRDSIPGRSSSSTSIHSLPPTQDTGSLSLPDDHEFRLPFNKAPGSHRGHQRHPSLSSSSDFGDRLSQQDAFDLHGGSFSQEMPLQRPQEVYEHDYRRHSGHYTGPYDHEPMRGGGGGVSQYQYASDPYPGPPHHYPPMMSDRPSRPPNRQMHPTRDSYSPSPGPPLDHRHHPPPSAGGPPGPTPPGHHYWSGHDGYNGPPPGHMHGPPGPGPPPPRGHGPPGPGRMADMQFHPIPFGPTTPDGPHSSGSLPSMSPAPSPHPTPPTTPPPSHHPPPPMMGMHSPMRMPHPMAPQCGPGPMPPPPGPGSGPHGIPPHPSSLPPRGGEFEGYRMPHPGNPPPPRGPPNMPHAPSPGPGHIGPPPPHGRIPPPDWNQPWTRHM